MEKKTLIYFLLTIGLLVSFLIPIHSKLINPINISNKTNFTKNISNVVYDRTATTDTYKNPDGTYTKILYSGAVNIKYGDKYVPFEDYLNVTEDRGKIKIEDLDKNVCYISLDYTKLYNLFNSSERIIINKSKGRWYFTTKINAPVLSMNYKLLNCSDYNVSFSNNSLNLGNKLKIDFNQARLEQNITTTYDAINKKLIFRPEKGKIADLSYIDPTITLQDADTEDLNDAGVKSSYPDNNYGYDSVARVGNRTTSKYRAYFQYSLSQLGSNITIINSTFYVNTIGGTAGGTNIVGIYRILNNNWVSSVDGSILNEGTITWNNQPCGTDFDNSTNCNLTYYDSKNLPIIGTTSFNCTKLINNTIEDGFTNVSIAFNYVSSNVESQISTKEHNPSTTRLEITYKSNTPLVTLNTPLNKEYLADNNVTLNCSAISSIYELSNITLYGNFSGIWEKNKTNNVSGLDVENTTTFNVILHDNTYLWNCLAKNTQNYEAFSVPNRTFIVDTIKPNINITSPPNNSLDLLPEQNVNYTVSDLHVGSCWYSNDTYTINYSLPSCQNITSVVWSIGNHNVTVWASDSAGNENSSKVTFTIDNTKPIIENISISTSAGSQTISFSFNASDTHLDKCWYSIFNSTGDIDPSTTENTSVACNSAGNSETVSAFGSYTLKIYANDSAGNENSSTKVFITSPSIGITTGGGGVTITYKNASDWTMTTPEGSDSFVIHMIPGISKNEDLKFDNNGEIARNITLSCIDITGEICKYISFESKNVTLPITKGISLYDTMKIDIPKNLSLGDYSAAITGTDEDNGIKIISLNVKVSSGFVPSIVVKLTSKFHKTEIPYLLVFLVIFILLGISSNQIIFKKVKAGSVWAFGTSLVISFIIIGLI